jgi:acyl dehydratase
MTRPRYLEDFAPGETFETGRYTVGLDEVTGFATAHDPQYFHTDPERAKAHPIFRGVSASGFLTMSITHRLIMALDLGHAWGMIGKGIDRLRWRRPVRPGDTLSARGEILSVTPQPGQVFGIVTTSVETVNQHGETVMSFTVHGVVPSRIALAPTARAA